MMNKKMWVLVLMGVMVLPVLSWAANTLNTQRALRTSDDSKLKMDDSGHKSVGSVPVQPVLPVGAGTSVIVTPAGGVLPVVTREGRIQTVFGEKIGARLAATIKRQRELLVLLSGLTNLDANTKLKLAEAGKTLDAAEKQLAELQTKLDALIKLKKDLVKPFADFKVNVGTINKELHDVSNTIMKIIRQLISGNQNSDNEQKPEKTENKLDDNNNSNQINITN